MQEEKQSDCSIDLHIIPIGDSDRPHIASNYCWCYPVKVDTGNWLHNAKDCREAKERITKEKCSAGWLIVGEAIIKN